MRIVRLFAVILASLAAGFLLAPCADAQPPSQLTEHITDSSGVLADADRVTIAEAIDQLYQDRRIQLWVVYVDNFSRYRPENWADKTRTASGMGDHDVLLAVATNTKAYAFSVPPQLQGLTPDELNSLRRNRIEPAVGSKDWAGAAIAAADRLDATGALNTTATKSTHVWLQIAIGVAVALAVAVAVLLLYRASRRRRTARRRVPGGEPADLDGPADPVRQALAVADARARQVSDYVSRHRRSVGAEAKTLVKETKQYLAAARRKETGNAVDAIADANRASTLAAQAQTLANADVQAAHRTPRRGGARN
ncbi:TPM domain-containing protein [Mycobacterium sherrisii]|uniref:TPM domain-containing protein n=1 Tax=Mycobacterium sherrisii TaxID=243061 RepID=UPI000A151AC2|nr:TPM domain-containing protein [Mycobacterium sherrisii]MCV7029947.1 TPM domain-containing protein [Mycobacterium sherrisii]ORW74857.1 hypothetical protein AWC25_15765 [Mycobacterium sherrisii]